MICKTCFHEIDDNVTTCPYCGTAMGDEDENAPTKHDNFEYPAYSGKESENVQEYNDENYDEDYDDEPYESSGKRLIFVIAGIIAGFVVFGCVLMAVLHFADGSSGKTTTTEPPSTTEEAVSTTLEEPSTEEATTEEPTTLPPTTQYDENGMPLPDGYYTAAKGYKVSASSLNVRKGPGTDKDKLFSVAKGEELIAVGYSNTIKEWIYVNYAKNNAYGWVSLEFLDGAAELTTQAESTTVPTTAPTTVASSATASTSSAAASTTDAMASTSAVSTTAPTTVPTTAPTTAATTDDGKKETPDTTYPEQKIYYVTAGSGLNMRKGPGSDYDKVAVLAKNATVKVVGANSGDSEWLYVYNETTKQYGWVSAAYIAEKTN